MSNKPDKTTNPKANDVDVQVGQAWSLHYRGENASAITAFKDILTRFAEHIDANFGLSLTLKRAGNKEEAKAAFLKTKSLIETELKRESSTTENAERLGMLSRMIDQHLAMM